MEYTDCEGYSETASDHARNPRHHGPLEPFNGHARLTGPCGDTMEFWLFVHNGQVENISFITDGCGASLACGSMASCLAEGKSIADTASMRQEDILDAMGTFPLESEHCALLAADSLKAACQDYLKHPAAPPQRACDTCGDSAGSAPQRLQGECDDDFEDRRSLQSRLARIRHRVIVLSGKGGVGKSTMAVNLATAIALSGKQVGLLDVDIHGPSVPTMLGLEGHLIQGCEDGILPVVVAGMKVMSLGFLLQNPDQAVIWRGPMKMGIIKQFLRDVVWGELDYLVIDSPPGTGDEPLSVCQLIGDLDGAVIVTTPQKVAAVDVRKSITFCRAMHIPVLGVVENMNGFACPKCGEVTQILLSGSGRSMAEDMGVPFLGSLPIDPQIAEACDHGRVFIHHYAWSPTAGIMKDIIKPILSLDEGTTPGKSHPLFQTRRINT